MYNFIKKDNLTERNGITVMFGKVLEYFRLICSLPHGSGNTGLVSDMLCDFAASRNLRYIKDGLGNVIIFKNGTDGYETSPAVILQGHIDMVCVKDDNTEIDFKKDGLSLLENENDIWANGTSLGGDDGVAVAYMLAVLDSDSIAHPPLECVFTVDEETGMYGAEALDMSVLSGKMLINLDSEEEGTMLVSCAGGVRLDALFGFDKAGSEKPAIKISLSGLTGGHSGTEIDKNRPNAVFALLDALRNLDGISLCEINGGSADNAIPTDCQAVITTDRPAEAEEKIKQYFEFFKEQYPDEKSATVTVEETAAEASFSEKDTKTFLSCMGEVPDGVVSMSADIKNLVQTSLNLGIIRTDESGICLGHALRSSVKNEKEALKVKVDSSYKKYGAAVTLHGDYPEWEFKKDSRLQKVIAAEFEKQSGKKMNITAIHAGLECGLFCQKRPGLDCVSLGPDIFDIHTSLERLSKKSAERVFELLLRVLEQLS